MIAPYTGQPITPGMIVCRRSVMTNGFAAHPVTIVAVSKSRATVRDRHDETEKRIDLSTIAFIVDTMEEGIALATANVEFLNRERVIAEQQAAERAERMRAAIAAAIGTGDAQAGKGAPESATPAAPVPRNRWKRKLIDAGVANLREFGYPSCTAENITTDTIFSQFFAGMLRENKGKSMDYDDAIDALLAEIAANTGAKA